MPLTIGQRARVRRVGRADEWCEAEVDLISANGGTVVLVLDDEVRTADDRIVRGLLELEFDNERDRAMGVDGTEYEIDVSGEEAAGAS